MATSTEVAIALGSNLGDREALLVFAIQRLSPILSNLRYSRWYDTDPVGVPFDYAQGKPADQPRYLNGATVGKTTLSARALLAELLAIEQAAGRTRPSPLAPRTLDLDLILYGSERIREPGLVVPHPRFRERLFVLEPLADIAPDLVDPESGKTISALLARARRANAS